MASKVLGELKGQGAKLSGEFTGPLNTKVKGLLDDAAGRTKANKRSTVKPQDV